MIVELHKLGFEEKLSRGKIFPRSYYSESNIYIYIYIYLFIYLFIFFIFDFFYFLFFPKEWFSCL